jgi:hypothetical protein
MEWQSACVAECQGFREKDYRKGPCQGSVRLCEAKCATKPQSLVRGVLVWFVYACVA